MSDYKIQYNDLLERGYEIIISKSEIDLLISKNIIFYAEIKKDGKPIFKFSSLKSSEEALSVAYSFMPKIEKLLASGIAG